MKTILSKIVIPVLGIFFAIGSSFATQASEKSVLAPTNGYVPNSVPCVNPYLCSNTGSMLCTIIFGGQSYRLFGKFTASDQNCIKTVYKP